MFINSSTIQTNNINFIYNYTDEDGNVKYKVIKSDMHYDIMPEEFKEKLSDTEEAITGIYSGIYRWELCIKKDDKFDPEEFKESEFYNSNDTSKYDGDGLLLNSNLKPFTVIFTTTMSPTLNNSYMWFNGLTIKTKNDYIRENEENTTIYGTIDGFGGLNSNDKILLGWDYNNSELFKDLFRANSFKN